MNLDAVIGVLVAVFAAQAFGHGGECVSEFAVVFHIGAFVGCKATLFGDVFINLVHVDEA